MNKDIKKKLEHICKTPQISLHQNEIRINRYLALCGIGSRREVEQYILNGKVSVNGVIVKDLSYKIKKEDLVIYDGKRITPQKYHIYLAVNKPKGYVVSKKTNKNEKSIYSLIPSSITKTYNLGYAGRLDKDSRGLVILTSDGLYIQHITHPKYKVLKKYYVQLDTPLAENDFNLLVGKGVINKKEKLKALSISVKDASKKIYEVILNEGKKRHIRRMFGALLYEVLDLYRVAIGKLDLETLKIQEGEYKEFDPSLVWGDKEELFHFFKFHKNPNE